MDDTTYFRNNLGDIPPIVEVPTTLTETVINYDDLQYLKDQLGA